MAKTPERSTSVDNVAAGLGRIDRPLSLVAQVEQALREAIAETYYPSGKLPNEIDLAEQLGVSRETVRRAAENLEQEGLIVKHRRRGTFIKPPTTPLQLQRPVSKILGYLQADYSGSDSEVVTRASSSLMFDGALAEAGLAGFQLMVRSAPPAQIRRAFEQLDAACMLRGMIFASVAEEKLLHRLSGRGLPTVLLDHDLHVPQISSVLSDSRQCARSAVERLAELGHRRIACAYWDQSDLNRWFPQGYRLGMKQAKLRCRHVWQIPVKLTRAGARRVVDTLLHTRPRPTAVICFHNTLANYVIEAAIGQGLAVPDDLSVVGGGGEEVLNLSSNQVDWHELGRLAMRVLLRAVEQGKAHVPEHHVAPYSFHHGETMSRACV